MIDSNVADVEKLTLLYVEDEDGEFNVFRERALAVWKDVRIERIKIFRLDAVVDRLDMCRRDGRAVDVILLDLSDERTSSPTKSVELWGGIQMLKQLRAHESVGQLFPIIACSKYGNYPGAPSVTFLANGGTDFFDKMEIGKALDAASWHIRLSRWATFSRRFRREVHSVPAVRGTLEGNGRFIQELRGRLKLLVRNGARFLCLYGETGVGKGRAVGYIKEQMGLKDTDTAEIQITNIPETLLEANLFGYVKGAFTDAKEDRAGALAGRKLIYLDEFQRIPVHLQVKLLRVLRERKFTRVGGVAVETIDDDAVFVVSLDAPPEELVRRGVLLPDIGGRLPLSVLEVLPLRRRKDEIDGLVHQFLQRRGERGRGASQPPPRIELEAGAVELIARSSFDWPYNIAQLEGFVEHLCNVRAGNIILRSDVERELQNLRGPELELALRVLRRYAFDRTLAADAWALLGRPGTMYLSDSNSANTSRVRRIICRVAADVALQKGDYEQHLEEQLLGSERFDLLLPGIVRREVKDLQDRLVGLWSAVLQSKLLEAAPQRPWRDNLARSRLVVVEQPAPKPDPLADVAKLLQLASVPGDLICGVGLLLALA